MSTRAVGAAPPARWLLIATVSVVACLTGLRLWLAAILDLRSDEAYYWTWSHEWVLSYLDQPPMVAWFERLGQLVFGDTPLGTRAVQLISLPLIELLLADIVRRRSGSWNAALFSVVAIECTLNYGMASIVVEPSIPLLLFSSVMLWAMCRLDETMTPRWWLLIGAAAGLALLSKYIALLLAPALLIFLLSRRHRHWLATPWPWMAALLALAAFSPVLIWNARNGWISFVFQGARLGGGDAPRIGGPLRFALYELLYVGVLVPAVLIGAVALAVRAFHERRAYEAAIATAFLVPLVLFISRSFTTNINQSWPYFMWPLGVVALSLALTWSGRWIAGKALTGASLLTGLPLVLAFAWHGLIDTSVWFGRNDPIGQDAGFGQMAQEVLMTARSSGATWIATTDYRTYADLKWHLRGSIPVVQVNERSRFLDFSPIDATRTVGRALYVHSGPPIALTRDAMLGPSQMIPVAWRGQVMREFDAQTLDGFAPELNPAPGTPLYVASADPVP